MSVDTRNERAFPGVAAPAEKARRTRVRTQLGLGEAALQLWRAKWLMLLVFLPIALLGAGASLMFPPQYKANTRLLIRVGQEYVYEPVVGEAGRGAFPQQDQILKAEAELAQSPVIAERVIKQIGLSRLYPKIAEVKARAPQTASVVDRQALARFAKDFSASSAPTSPLLKLTFVHSNPELAAETLNALVQVYIDYRREVLDARPASALSDERAAVESRLETAEEALRAFLSKNDVSDFLAEKDVAIHLFGMLTDKLSDVDASRRETESRITSLRSQLATLPRQTEPRQTEPRQTDLLSSVGPNPTKQALETDFQAAKANVEALKGKGAELLRQRAEAEKRRTSLAALEPEFQRLSRERDVLMASAQTFAVREQTERLRIELAGRNANNISIFEPARGPADGSSPQRLLIIAGAALGLAVALLVGLLSAFSLQTLPTARSVERTLGLRVLDTTGVAAR